MKLGKEDASSAAGRGRGKGHGRRAGKGSGRSKGKDGMRRSGTGGRGYCICTRCGERVLHRRGVPCIEHRCPSCGGPMMGEKTGPTISKGQGRLDTVSQGRSDRKGHPTVDRTKCIGCGICVDTCPAGAITMEGEKASIDPGSCRDCGLCISACPQDAIEP